VFECFAIVEILISMKFFISFFLPLQKRKPATDYRKNCTALCSWTKKNHFLSGRRKVAIFTSSHKFQMKQNKQDQRIFISLAIKRSEERENNIGLLWKCSELSNWFHLAFFWKEKIFFEIENAEGLENLLNDFCRCFQTFIVFLVF
jgi:hypothetical protein